MTFTREQLRTIRQTTMKNALKTTDAAAATQAEKTETQRQIEGCDPKSAYDRMLKKKLLRISKKGETK